MFTLKNEGFCSKISYNQPVYRASRSGIVATIKTLEQALRDILQDDHKVSKYDAQAIKEMILADGKVTKEEQLFIERALVDNILDEKAYAILSQLLLRSEM